MSDFKIGDYVYATQEQQCCVITHYSKNANLYTLRKIDSNHHNILAPKTELQKITIIKHSSMDEFERLVKGKSIRWSRWLGNRPPIKYQKQINDTDFKDTNGMGWNASLDTFRGTDFFWYYIDEDNKISQVPSNYLPLCKCNIKTKIERGHACDSRYAPY